MFNSNGHQTADCGPMSPPEDEPIWCRGCGGLHEGPECDPEPADVPEDDFTREEGRPDDD